MNLKNLLFGCFSAQGLFISKEIRLGVVNHYAIQKLKISFCDFLAEATLAIFHNIIIDCLIDDIMEQDRIQYSVVALIY